MIFIVLARKNDKIFTYSLIYSQYTFMDNTLKVKKLNQKK